MNAIFANFDGRVSDVAHTRACVGTLGGLLGPFDDNAQVEKRRGPAGLVLGSRGKLDNRFVGPVLRSVSVSFHCNLVPASAVSGVSR